jgi:hypothetical protein
MADRDTDHVFDVLVTETVVGHLSFAAVLDEAEISQEPELV